MLDSTEKIIQILAVPATLVGTTTYSPVLYGLSDKGRLFVKGWGENQWNLMNNGIQKENS